MHKGLEENKKLLEQKVDETKSLVNNNKEAPSSGASPRNGDEFEQDEPADML